MLTGMKMPPPRFHHGPAEWAATVAVVLAVSLGHYGHAYAGWLGVFIAGGFGIFVSLIAELNADQPVTNDYDAARAINAHARNLRLRERAGLGERLAHAETEADMARMLLAFRTIFIAEAMLGGYMFTRFDI